MAMNQEANTPMVLTIGAVSCLLILVIMFGVEAWFRNEERNEVVEQWDDNPNTWLEDMRTPQKDRLVAPPSKDPKTNTMHIPIDEAIKLFIESKGELPAAPATQPATAPTTLAN
jgi:hypothetical protein